jgi:hypothetical protein
MVRLEMTAERVATLGGHDLAAGRLNRTCRFSQRQQPIARFDDLSHL